MSNKKIENDNSQSVTVEKTEDSNVVLAKDYGKYGKIETIDLSELATEVDYLVYAQWK